MKTILLTGASGVVGRTLIDALGDCRLLCLIHRMPVSAPHVSCITGDITRPRLGLTRSEYNAIGGRIDLVLHAAAVTDFEQPRDAIMQTNVVGTRHVVDLTRDAGVPLIYVGTAFSQTRSSLDRFDANAYEVSKRDAEAVVRDSGVAAVIVRPSIVVGDSVSGAIMRFQGFHYILGMWMRGLLPIGAGGAASLVDFVPQDLVASAIAALIARGDRHGEHWITLGDRALTLERIVDLCIAYAARIDRRIVTRPRIYDFETFDRLIRPVFFHALPASLRQSFDRAMTVARYLNIDHPFPTSLPQFEADFGIALPPPETTLLRNLDYWLQRNDKAA